MLSRDLSDYAIENVSEIDSPSLLVYEERIDENLRRMVAQAGGADRLCPHVKTHKLPQVIEKQIKLGITKFKARPSPKRRCARL
jgi:D-threonine aldolase